MPEFPNYIIGVDIGGTRIKFGLLDAIDGSILHQHTVPTRDGEWTGADPAWTVAIREYVAAVEKERGPARAVGIAAPGLAAADNRCIVKMPGRLNGLEGLDWTQWLGRPASVLNDAHAALLGECWCGAAQGLRHVVLLTLGTGVGGAILIDGKLLQGHTGRAGHLGHLTVDADGPPTIAGMPGGLDSIIGNATVAARSENRFTSTAELTDAVRSGDPFATAVWQRSVYQLACGVGSLLNVLDPEAVVIGGGIAEVGDLLFLPLRQHLDKIEWRPLGKATPVLPALLGEWAGTFGAAKFALR